MATVYRSVLGIQIDLLSVVKLIVIFYDLDEFKTESLF